MKKNGEKKQMITTGIIRWLRFPILFVSVFIGAEVLKFEENWSYYLLVFLILIGFGYLLWNRRRLKHDNTNLYIKRGNDERRVPLSNIVSIKRSSTKVNGSRYWILIYLDEIKEEQKLRFNSDFNKEFFDTVRDRNPEVIIWEHPFFKV